MSYLHYMCLLVYNCVGFFVFCFLFFVFVLCLVYTILPVFRDCPFFTLPFGVLEGLLTMLTSINMDIPSI